MSSKINYSEVRVYLQASGGYRAWATVERLDADGKAATRTEFSATHADRAEALIEALRLAGFEDEGAPT